MSLSKFLFQVPMTCKLVGKSSKSFLNKTLALVMLFTSFGCTSFNGRSEKIAEDQAKQYLLQYGSCISYESERLADTPALAEEIALAAQSNCEAEFLAAQEAVTVSYQVLFGRRHYRRAATSAEETMGKIRAHEYRRTIRIVVDKRQQSIRHQDGDK